MTGECAIETFDIIFEFQIDLKGSLGSLFQLFLCFGCMISYAVGPYVSYQTLVFVSATIPIVCILTFIWIPESPFYLLCANRKQEAFDALMWLRGYPDSRLLQDEMTEIMVRNRIQNSMYDDNVFNQFTTIFRPVLPNAKINEARSVPFSPIEHI